MLALLSLIRPRVSLPLQHSRHHSHLLRKCVLLNISMSACVTPCFTLQIDTVQRSLSPGNVLQHEPARRHYGADHARRPTYWHTILACTTMTTAHPSITSPDENANSRLRHWSPMNVVMPPSNTWHFFGRLGIIPTYL